MTVSTLQVPRRTNLARIFSSELILRTPWWPIVFRWGALGLIVSLILSASLLLTSFRYQSTDVLSFIWGEAVLAGLLAFVGLFIHESGHAVAGRLVGRTIVRLQFGLAGGAITSGDTTPIRRIVGLAAGPLAEISFGLLLLSVSGGNLANPLAVAGFIAIINGAGNLLPFHKVTDGFKIMRFARLALRGNRPLQCVPVGPCSACSV